MGNRKKLEEFLNVIKNIPKKCLNTKNLFKLLKVDIKTAIEMGIVINLDNEYEMEMPTGTYAKLTERSSALTKKSLILGAGIIDADYRDEVSAVIINLSNKTQQIANVSQVNEREVGSGKQRSELRFVARGLELAQRKFFS